MSFRQSIASVLSGGWRFLRRRWATLCWLVVTLALLATLALATLLPSAVEKVVNKLAAGLSADGAIDVTITRIGLFGSDLSCRSSGDTHGGPDGIERYLNIPSVSINYQPLQLLRGQISSVDIDGARVTVLVKDGRAELPLLKLLKRAPATPEAASSAPFDLPAFYASLPVRVDAIHVSGDVMVCTPHEIIPIACQLRLQPPPATDRPVIDFQVQLRHSRNNLRGTGRVVMDTARMYASVQWQTDSEAMPLSIRRLLPAQCQASFSGQADILFALASMDLQVFIAEFASKARRGQQRAEITGNAALALNVQTGALSALDARLESIIDLSEQFLVVQCQPVITAKLQADQQLALSVSGISADIAGNTLAINRIDAVGDSAGMAASGSALATFNDQALPPLAFTVSRDQDAIAIGLSSANETTPAPVPVSGHFGGYDIRLSAPTVSAQAQFNDGGHCQLSLSCQNLRVANDAQRAAMSTGSVSINGHAQFGDNIDYRLAMTCDDLAFTRDDIQADMNAATVDISGSDRDATARVQLSALSAQCPPGIHAAIGACSADFSANGPDVQAVVRVNDGRLAIPKQDFSAQFTLDWPLLWPPPASDAPIGVFHVSDCQVGQEAMGAMDGTATLSQAGLAIAADASLRGLTAAIQADLAPFPAADVALRAAFTLPEQPLPSGILPVSLAPQLADFSITGRVAGDAVFSMAGGKQQGKAAISFSDGVVANPKQKLAVSGLKLSFALPDLPAIRSGGNQQASFQELSLGNIAISNGRLRFAMERPDSWLVESLSFKWCDGRIRLNATRFSPETERPRLTLTCDRVKLGALLEQLGVGQDQGEGRISGTIPVVLTNHGPRFRDAFLYSTPGETGMIRLRPASTLSAMAAASDQLSLALDALSDYSYSWVRLSLDSDKDMLKLKLETDGKPTQPLYYAPKDGSIVRSAVASIFQGLQLNANFNIPLEKSTELFQNFNQLFKQP